MEASWKVIYTIKWEGDRPHLGEWREERAGSRRDRAAGRVAGRGRWGKGSQGEAGESSWGMGEVEGMKGAMEVCFRGPKF